MSHELRELHQQRLETWAAAIDKVPDRSEAFDTYGQRVEFDLSIVLRRDECGTAACAVGLLPFVFPADFVQWWGESSTGLGGAVAYGTVARRDAPSDPLVAAEDFTEFFGIDSADLNRIACPAFYGSHEGGDGYVVHPRHVAARIREVAARAR